MDLWGQLVKMAEAPVVALLAIVVVALAWTLTRVLLFLPRVPDAIVGAMSEAGEMSSAAFRQRLDDLQETIDELQQELQAERLRVDQANMEIAAMKRRLMSADAYRRRALRQRDEWKRKAVALEAQVRSLETQVAELRRQVRELTGKVG